MNNLAEQTEVAEHTPLVGTAEPMVVAATSEPFQSTSMQLEALGEKFGEYKPYDSQLPIAEIAGSRVVKCLYQKSSSQASSYVRVPTKHLTEELILERIAELTPYVLTFLQDVEDSMIKADHKAGLLSVYTESLSLDKLIERLEAAEQGARLNKEKIEAWFDDCIAEDLVTFFAAKMNISNEPTEDELAKLALVLGAYKKKFASLASGKTFIKEADCIAMAKVIQECGAGDSLIGSRFIARLDKMSQKEEDLLLTL